MQQRVAVFVDGENLGAAHADSLLGIAMEHGEIVVARVYGDVARLDGWRNAHRFTLVHAGAGKNAADILMALDAFDLARDGRFGACILGSSDRDFSHLAARLRERGLTVVGAGEPKTPERFRVKCSQFAELGVAKKQSAPNSTDTEPTKGRYDRQIEALISQYGGVGGMTIQKLGEQMKTQHETSCADLDEKNWRAYLERRPSLYTMQGNTFRVTARSITA
jgi:uncharacterized LabA/DUF88 family protein